MAKITTIGMYSFDPTLFDGVVFPAGINKQLAVDEILTRSGEFEIIYPDVSFFKAMLEHWANKHYRTFEKWVEGLAAEFDPLYNYDRFEEYQDERTGSDSRTGKSLHNGVNNEQITNSHEASTKENGVENVSNTSTASTGTTGSRSTTNNELVENGGETENTVSAFDSSAYEPKDKQTSSTSQSTNATTGEVSGTDSTSSGTSGTTTASGSIGSESGTESSARNGVTADEHHESENRVNNEVVKHTAHLYGNIGVTTSAQMLREFLDVERFNIYENIADLFIDEFCILVY